MDSETKASFWLGFAVVAALVWFMLLARIIMFVYETIVSKL